MNDKKVDYWLRLFDRPIVIELVDAPLGSVDARKREERSRVQKRLIYKQLSRTTFDSEIQNNNAYLLPPQSLHPTLYATAQEQANCSIHLSANQAPSSVSPFP